MSRVTPGCTDLRSTPWPTSCSCKPPPASRALSRPSARKGQEICPGKRHDGRSLKIRRGSGGVACMLPSTSVAPFPPFFWKTVLLLSFCFRLGQMKFRSVSENVTKAQHCFSSTRQTHKHKHTEHTLIDRLNASKLWRCASHTHLAKPACAKSCRKVQEKLSGDSILFLQERCRM